MRIYTSKENKLVELDEQALFQKPVQESNIWIDLLSPSKEEKKRVENYLSLSIPTKEEMQEIESSSRLYKEHEALIMTINVVKKENGIHKLVNITFLLKNNALVTVRYEELNQISMFLKSTSGPAAFPVNDSVSLLLGILEVFVEKIADTIEIISTTVEVLSEKIFTHEAKKTHQLREALITLGLQGEINSKTRDSLSSISRMIGYLKFNINKEDVKRFENRLETLALDAVDLKDHSSFLGHKINFILDASLGLINIEQNNIIKIFSIAAVVLLPPTLIASIYGMNFRHLPELNWQFGYPLAILLMILSAIIPYWYIKRKGWL